MSPKINSIQLINFKCFQKVEIDLSKITLLTGANSSGKSSLLYGILSPLQTDNFPLYYSPNGQYINMGDFEEFSYKHSHNSEIGISLVIINEYGNTVKFITKWSKDSKTGMPSLKELDIKSELLKLNISKKYSHYRLSYEMRGTSPLNLIGKKATSAKGETGTNTKAINLIEEEVDKLILSIAIDSSKKRKQNLEQVYTKFKNTKRARNIQLNSLSDILGLMTDVRVMKARGILSTLDLLLEKVNDRLNFISSFRVLPERTYYKEVIYDKKIGKYGENYVQQIAEWENQESIEFKKLNEILRDLGILYKVQTNKLKGGRIELRAKTSRRSVLSSILDIGFGVSQLLPILVADLQLQNGSTLIISQPEIHIHPSVQAALADYFVSNVKERNKNYIIETHSEYLINRLRLNIVKETLNKDDVRTYFFENTHEGSVIHNVNFTNRGEINNAPKGFFDTYMIDVMNIAMEA